VNRDLRADGTGERERNTNCEVAPRIPDPADFDAECLDDGMDITR
jgi:hypothetical protein